MDSNDGSAPATRETLGEPPGPCTMVIFGAGGDLTKRKLIPAIYNLAKGKLLPEKFAIVGVSVENFSTDEFRAHATEEIKGYSTSGADEKTWEWFAQRLFYIQGDFNDPGLYKKLEEQLGTVEKEEGTGGSSLFYLATSPTFFATIAKHLGEAGLTKQDDKRWRRVVIEKPFGHDLASAVALNRALLESLEEKQIFRIDHYLGKETVQNILAFRFANGIFEPVWNRRYVDHVQVTVAEELGVEMRGGYYDTAGALRDMVPNHIFQLITLTAMEPPISFAAEEVHDEQTKVLRAIQLLTPEHVLDQAVRGQYGEGTIDGKRVPAYRAEPNVAPNSNTPTYVAMALHIDNWRWAGVPFYLRTGKRLPGRNTHVVIQFRRAPFMLFRETQVENMMPNQLVLHIQPEEGISLRFAAKTPGTTMQLGEVNMDFAYADYFGVTSSTGYERLLHDCMIGDATLFQRADMVEAGWSIVNPVLDVWKALPPRNFPNYPADTWGPKESDELMERDGRRWRNFEK